jgi:hypothetical protein
MILGWVIEAAEQDGTSLAPYSTVCSEWQVVIEPATFRSLNSHPHGWGFPGSSPWPTHLSFAPLERRASSRFTVSDSEGEHVLKGYLAGVA